MSSRGQFPDDRELAKAAKLIDIEPLHEPAISIDRVQRQNQPAAMFAVLSPSSDR
jgi:hypothetical protein